MGDDGEVINVLCPLEPKGIELGQIFPLGRKLYQVVAIGVYRDQNYAGHPNQKTAYSLRLMLLRHEEP